MRSGHFVGAEAHLDDNTPTTVCVLNDNSLTVPEASSHGTTAHCLIIPCERAAARNLGGQATVSEVVLNPWGEMVWRGVAGYAGKGE